MERYAAATDDGGHVPDGLDSGYDCPGRGPYRPWCAIPATTGCPMTVQRAGTSPESGTGGRRQAVVAAARLVAPSTHPWLMMSI